MITCWKPCKAQEILDRAPLAVIPKIMSHLLELAQCTIAPYEKQIHDFIKCNKRHLRSVAKAQFLRKKIYTNATKFFVTVKVIWIWLNRKSWIMLKRNLRKKLKKI